jgi:hypothetical protein
MRPHASFLISRRMLLLNNLCACSCLHSNTQYEIQGAGVDYLRKAKINAEYAGFLRELQMPAAAPIQQTERNGIKLVAACIEEGMWLESHYLASLLPLKSVTNLDSLLDYRIHLRSQRILTPLEAGGV